jgi:hypothetical protein
MKESILEVENYDPNSVEDEGSNIFEQKYLR